MKPLFFLLFMLIAAPNMAQTGRVVQVNIEGGIGPATADFLARAIEAGQGAQLVLIVLNTPGGLDASTRSIVQSILSSKVPVVTFVAPDGARAASAGTFILYASTVAAMAPSSHLGAASPVSLGGMGAGDKKDEDGMSTMEKKVSSDAVAYIRALAQLRGRNVAFAEKAILEAATLTASEALKDNVIEVIARDVPDLLRQLNGKEVQQSGEKITLHTEQVPIERFEPDWRMKFLLVITEPTVAYLLLLLGVYGIFFELFNPGFLVPGIVGGVAIIIALYALQMLPVNYAGLGLIVLGIAFIIAEIYHPGVGALGIGGTIAFIIGSVLLMDTEVEGFQIAWSAILGMAAANIVLFGTFLMMAMRTRQQACLNSTERLIGQYGQVVTAISPQGQIMIGGEIWEAHSESPIATGATVKVVSVAGLQLVVEPVHQPGEREHGSMME
ncbi:MAG: nodulation protein NfeD [Legionellaceae bacterium]|nr:nodulation protein NfeD [Legionellaceae bacterium]